MTDHPQAAVDALAAMLTSNLIVNSPHPHHSARAILDTIAPLLTAPLQAELDAVYADLARAMEALDHRDDGYKYGREDDQ